MDKYIIGECDAKKTYRMLEEAKKSGAVVACKNPYRMAQKADNYGIWGVEFVSYDDVDSLAGEKIAIDELGDFFKCRFGVELDAFTMTVD